MKFTEELRNGKSTNVSSTEFTGKKDENFRQSNKAGVGTGHHLLPLICVPLVKMKMKIYSCMASVDASAAAAAACLSDFLLFLSFFVDNCLNLSFELFLI